MHKAVIGALAALALTAPVATAQTTVKLGKREARRVIIKDFPAAAPRLMLKDERAAFFRTQTLKVEPARRCERMSARQVSCDFTARLRPDAAHRKAHWFPIRCVGAQRVFKKDDGSYIGTMGNYVCRTILPKS